MAVSQNKAMTAQEFMVKLEGAVRDKDVMLDLAAETIRNSHTKATFSKRELPKTQTALDMKAVFIYAKMAPRLNEKVVVYPKKDLSTDERLVLIKQQYQKRGYGDFDADFKKKYPREFGVKLYTNNMYVNRQASMSL